MRWYVPMLLVGFGTTLGSGCKQLQQGSNRAPDFVQTRKGAAGSEDTLEPGTKTPVRPAEAVQAKLAGYPEMKSPNPQVEISVSAVAEYKFKVVESVGACQTDTDYSPYVPATTPIKLDLSTRKESPAIVAVCVLGRDDSGQEQSFATLASWLWAPEIPSMSDQIDLIDGNNEIKITPKAPSGNWLIVRSKEALNASPEDGKDYTVDQAIGNGTVIVVGPMAEFVDKTVKNEESWIYNFFAYNAARRFSVAQTKSMTLSKQELLWVPKAMIQAGQVALEARANNKRYICRSPHVDPATQESRGMQPGTMITANNDLKAGACFYEYGGAIFRNLNYQLLMANKGNPADLVRWARGAVTATGATIPNGSIIAGTDDTGAVQGPALYICLTLNAQIAGKAGTHLPQGCLSYNGTNGTPSLSTSFDVLALK